MKENGKNKREWVKTAAIIFLSVMLVLTFFSQTIMNYSLPEVATTYVQSGTITAKIRGTGTIESGDPYEIKVTESRKVSSVAVRVGDTVQKGDVLLYLDDSESDELKAAREALEAAQDAYEMALLTADITSSDIYSANQNVSATTYRQQITNAQAAIKAAEDAVPAFEVKVEQLNQAISDHSAQLSYENAMLPGEETAEENARVRYSNAVKALESAQQEREDAVSNGDADAQAAAEARIKAAEAEKTAAYDVYSKASSTATNRRNAITNLTNAKNTYVLQSYIAERELKAAQKTVEEKKDDLDKLMSKITTVTGLEGKLDDIKNAQALVDELSAKSINATVTADIAGIVSQINVTAGNTTSAATPVVVLQPEGKGYTLSFSVTNEQARRLAVGDRADLVNAWRYDDVTATLASIKPDKSDPGQRKMLTFDVTGSIVAGQTLNLSVGQKSANYDLIVPNSAIREDSNGKFILIVESKSTPLSNRYIATRVDVEVIASDDTQSAVSGGLYGYEYVITTSTKPVEAGKQVRLANN